MMVNEIVNEFSLSLYIHVIYHSVVTLVIRLVIEMAFIFNQHKTGLPVHVAQIWVSCTCPGTDFPLFMYGCTKILNLSGICCSFGFGAPNGISLMGI